MEILKKFLNNETQLQVKISLRLLDDFRTDTDSMLFIELIKRMIRQDPDHRETSEKLLDHAIFKDNAERLGIIKSLSKKCYAGDKCINQFLVKVMNKNEVHLEGTVEHSEPLKDLLAELTNYPEKPDIKICSSLVRLFEAKVILLFFF